MTDLTARLDEIEARADTATDGPWAFGTAPAEGSDESKAEYLSRALTGAGPLYALWVPASVGHPDGYLVPAVTGDGPNAGNNAEFIAHARTDVPSLVAALRAVLELADAADVAAADDPDQEFGLVYAHHLRAAITSALDPSTVSTTVTRLRARGFLGEVS